VTEIETEIIIILANKIAIAIAIESIHVSSIEAVMIDEETATTTTKDVQKTIPAIMAKKGPKIIKYKFKWGMGNRKNQQTKSLLLAMAMAIAIAIAITIVMANRMV